MGTTKRPDKKTKIYVGKNGYTSTFTKVRVNEGSVWKRTGGSSKPPKKAK